MAKAFDIPDYEPTTPDLDFGAEANPAQDQVLYGHTTAVAPNQTATVLYTPTMKEAVDWEVHLQIPTLPPNINIATTSTNGYFLATVTYTLGESVYRKKFYVNSTAAYRFKVTSRRVQVDVAWSGVTSPITTPTNVVSGCSKVSGFGASPLDYYLVQWQPRNAANTDGFIIDGTPLIYGILSAYQATLTAMPTGAGASACCAMFFDATSTPTTGDRPIWVTPPFTQAFQWFSFDDGLTPTVRYSTGLYVKLSSTFGTFTACGSGGTLRVDSRLGS